MLGSCRQGLFQVKSSPYTGEDCARGVFASQEIQQGALVEVAHCIKLSAQEYYNYGRHTTLEHYLFTGKSGSMLLALGVGSLFNHNRQPNLDYRVDHDKLIIRYFAAKNVPAGEELTIFYGDKLWFEDTSSEPLSSGIHNASTVHDHMDNEDTFLGNMIL